MNNPDSLPATRLFQINTGRGVLRILPGLIVAVEKLNAPTRVGDNNEISDEPLYRVRIHLETAIEASTFLDIRLQTIEQQDELFERVSEILMSYMDDEGEPNE
jgi:hypothetical protein